MKKLMTVLLGVLVAATTLTAALTSSGQIAANIPLTTAITVTSYPTSLANTPAPVTAGVALAATTVVQGGLIVDNSIAGWSLQVDGAGVLTNATNGATMAYALQVVSGAGLGAGLTFTPPANLTLGTAVLCGGTATAASAYNFDLTMTIANDAAGTLNKLAGDYVDTILLTVASLD